MPLIATQKLDMGVRHDPLWNKVKLSVPFDGSDAATSATDESNSNHTLTFNGNAQLDTADKQFGSASLLCDGTGDYVTTGNTTDFDLTGDFTIELWAKTSTNKQAGLMDLGSGSSSRWIVFQNTGGLVQFWESNNVNILTFDFDLHTSGWTHIAITRQVNTFRLYKNLSKVHEAVDAATIQTGNHPLHIGSDSWSTSSRSFNGWIDSPQVVIGEARYVLDNYNTPILPPASR